MPSTFYRIAVIGIIICLICITSKQYLTVNQLCIDKYYNSNNRQAVHNAVYFKLKDYSIKERKNIMFRNKIDLYFQNLDEKWRNLSYRERIGYTIFGYSAYVFLIVVLIFYTIVAIYHLLDHQVVNRYSGNPSIKKADISHLITKDVVTEEINTSKTKQ